MSRRARVLDHDRLAGHLEALDDGRYRFTYCTEYLAGGGTGVSLTLPPRPAPYEADRLFPFFHGLLAEGSTRALQLRTLKIDEDDPFGLLLATASETIGSVTVEEDDGP